MKQEFNKENILRSAIRQSINEAVEKQKIKSIVKKSLREMYERQFDPFERVREIVEDYWTEIPEKSEGNILVFENKENKGLFIKVQVNDTDAKIIGIQGENQEYGFSDSLASDLEWLFEKFAELDEYYRRFEMLMPWESD